MKKLGRIFLSLCALFLLSGCVKYNVSMGIDKDKHMDLQIIVAFDEETFKQMMNEMDKDYDEESLSSMFDMSEGKSVFKKRGYEVEDYSEGNYNGIIANLKIDNIDNVSVNEDLQVVLSDLLNEEFDDSKFFKVEKKSDKNIYTAHFIYEADDSDDDTMDNIPGLDLKYTVKLPYKVISDNAHSKRSNELTWNVSMDKQTDIKYSFEIPNDDSKEVASTEDNSENAFIGFISNNIMIIGIVALVLVIIIVVIIVLASKGKKKNNNKQINTVINKGLVSDKTDVVVNQENPNISSMPEVISDEEIKLEDTNNGVLSDENIDGSVSNNQTDEIVSNEQVFINTELEVQHDEKHNEVRVCKNCGVEVQNDQKFCMNCGNKLD